MRAAALVSALCYMVRPASAGKERVEEVVERFRDMQQQRHGVYSEDAAQIVRKAVHCSDPFEVPKRVITVTLMRPAAEGNFGKQLTGHPKRRAIAGRISDKGVVHANQVRGISSTREIVSQLIQDLRSAGYDGFFGEAQFCRRAWCDSKIPANFCVVLQVEDSQATIHVLHMWLSGFPDHEDPHEHPLVFCYS